VRSPVTTIFLFWVPWKSVAWLRSYCGDTNICGHYLYHESTYCHRI